MPSRHTSYHGFSALGSAAANVVSSPRERRGRATEPADTIDDLDDETASPERLAWLAERVRFERELWTAAGALGGEWRLGVPDKQAALDADIDRAIGRFKSGCEALGLDDRLADDGHRILKLFYDRADSVIGELRDLRTNHGENACAHFLDNFRRKLTALYREAETLESSDVAGHA